ncbi:hypothetical protein BHM03_00040147 [Ensete ventricosum]|nr:hypothetical protein BHM03_00040147 [Ensete ventricosum]
MSVRGAQRGVKSGDDARLRLLLWCGSSSRSRGAVPTKNDLYPGGGSSGRSLRRLRHVGCLRPRCPVWEGDHYYPYHFSLPPQEEASLRLREGERGRVLRVRGWHNGMICGRFRLGNPEGGEPLDEAKRLLGDIRD